MKEGCHCGDIAFAHFAESSATIDIPFTNNFEKKIVVKVPTYKLKCVLCICIWACTHKDLEFQSASGA